MRALAGLRVALRALLRRDDLERDLDEELRFHVEMQTAKNLRLGMPPDQARRAALVAFGGRERFKEEVRDERGTRWLEDLARDVRHAARALRRAPGFTVASVASLALGVGASAAVFALAHAVLLQPLPLPEPERLVAVGHAAPGLGSEAAGLSAGTYRHYRAHNRTLDDLAVYFDRVLNLTDGAEPELVDAALVSPNLFAVLGVAPAHGRVFDAADEQPDARSVVVLSHALWVRRYGADPRIVGRTIEVNRAPREVVGIMPADFRFPAPGTQLWFAFPIEPTTEAELHGLSMTGVGRLRPGASPDDAARDLARLVPTLAGTFADVTPRLLAESGLRARVLPLRDAVTRDVRPALVLVLGTTVFVLLITWANVANLGLVRAERRRREVAVARALGAGTVHVLRRALSEGALLALGGGAAALLLAALGVATRYGFAPGEIPRLHEVRLSGTVLAVVAALSALSALLMAGVAVAGGGVAGSLTALRGGAGRMSASRRGQWTRHGLVALQVALSLALLVGSAIMAQSYWRLRQAELGFQPERVLAFDIELPFSPYPSYEAGAGFFGRLTERLRGVPGVLAAESSSILPLTALPEYYDETVVPDDAAGERPLAPDAAVGMATPGFFAAMGIPVLRGRSFQPGDARTDAPAVVVTAELARTHFGEGDPVGRRVRIGADGRRAFTVVGVVGDVPAGTFAAGPRRALYLPVLDDLSGASESGPPLPRSPGAQTVVVRTSVPPASVVPALRRIVRDLDPKVPIARLRTMDDVVAGASARARLTAALLVAAAVAALALGVIGLYGVVSYAVALRTSEFGVRIALGAEPARVQRMVLRQGALVALVGIAVGMVAAVATTRLLRGLLYEVSPNDPLAFLAMPALLLAVALLASYLPARRAARTDPVAALRAE